jgi:hypothetical protein
MLPGMHNAAMSTLKNFLKSLASTTTSTTAYTARRTPLLA